MSFWGQVGLTDKTSYTARVALLKWLQDSYTGTTLKNDWEIKNILALSINVASPSNEVINYSGNFVNNVLWWSVVVSSISSSSSSSWWASNSCNSTQPTNATLTIWTPTSQNQAWQNTNSWNPCYVICSSWYYWNWVDCTSTPYCNVPSTISYWWLTYQLFKNPYINDTTPLMLPSGMNLHYNHVYWLNITSGIKRYVTVKYTYWSPNCVFNITREWYALCPINTKNTWTFTSPICSNQTLPDCYNKTNRWNTNPQSLWDNIPNNSWVCFKSWTRAVAYKKIWNMISWNCAASNSVFEVWNVWSTDDWSNWEYSIMWFDGNSLCNVNLSSNFASRSIWSNQNWCTYSNWDNIISYAWSTYGVTNWRVYSQCYTNTPNLINSTDYWIANFYY